MKEGQEEPPKYEFVAEKKVEKKTAKKFQWAT